MTLYSWKLDKCDPFCCVKSLPLDLPLGLPGSSSSRLLMDDATEGDEEALEDVCFRNIIDASVGG
jgi:hypothetical protein